MKIKRNLVVLTHFNKFHADEVLAEALLRVFIVNDESSEFEDIDLLRIPHIETIDALEASIMTKLEIESREEASKLKLEELDKYLNFDFLLDTGGRYDQVRYFDHHHRAPNVEGYSTAGLIWKYLKDKLGIDYPSIDNLVSLVDAHDNGITVASLNSFPMLVGLLNSCDKTNNREQDTNFKFASKFAAKVIQGMIRDDDASKYAIELFNQGVDVNKAVRYVGRYVPKLADVVTGEIAPDTEAVYWMNDDGTYSLRTLAKRPGTFEKNGREIKQYNEMNFVHKSGFYAVAPNAKVMAECIDKSFPDEV